MEHVSYSFEPSNSFTLTKKFNVHYCSPISFYNSVLLYIYSLAETMATTYGQRAKRRSDYSYGTILHCRNPACTAARIDCSPMCIADQSVRY